MTTQANRNIPNPSRRRRGGSSRRAWFRGLAAGLVFGIAGAAFTPSSHAESGIDPTYQTSAMFGIDRTTGALMKFDFSANKVSEVGKIKAMNNSVYTGIEASAYIPGQRNIIAFWTNPADNLTRLIYVDVLDGRGAPVGSDLGEGQVLGATSAKVTVGGVSQWTVFALHQVEQIKAVSKPIGGTLNINPNNSPQNEFTLTKPDDSTLTRDDMHAGTGLDKDTGIIYDGAAKQVVVKPKGNGSQNTVTVNGSPFEIKNNTTYVFSGDMTAKVYNDKVHKNGKAMGKWYIDFGGSITVEENVIENRVVKVDHRTGSVSHMMTLNNEYESLSTTDGSGFYAVKGNELYLINTAAKTETKLGTVAKNKIQAMAFAGSTLFGFDNASNTLQPTSASNGASLGSAAGVGMSDLGTMVIVPLSSLPDSNNGNFD